MSFLKFEIFSLVIDISILVNRAVLDEMVISAPGLIKPIVELLIADPDPIKNSVRINSILFYSNVYTSSSVIHCLF